MLFLEPRRVQTLHVHWKTTESNKRVQKEEKYTEDWILGIDITALFFCSTSKKACTSSSHPKTVSLPQFHKLQERSHCCHAHSSYSWDLSDRRTKKYGAGYQALFRIFQIFFFFVELYFSLKNYNITLRTQSYRIIYVLRTSKLWSGPTLLKIAILKCKNSKFF